MYLTGVHRVAMFVRKHWAHGWEETEANQGHRQGGKEQLSGLRQRGEGGGRQAGEDEKGRKERRGWSTNWKID